MELQDVVNRLRMKQSIKAIKRETGKHRSSIRKVLQLAEQEGWLDEQQELPSEQQLQEVYHEQQSAEEGHEHPLDAHREQIAGWRKEDYSFLAIHQLLEKRGGGVLRDHGAPLHVSRAISVGEGCKHGALESTMAGQ